MGWWFEPRLRRNNLGTSGVCQPGKPRFLRAGFARVDVPCRELVTDYIPFAAIRVLAPWRLAKRGIYVGPKNV